MEGALSGRTGSNDSGYVVMWDKSKFSYLNHSKDKLTYGNNWKLTREGWYNMKVNDEAIARPPQIVCLKPNGTNSEIELRIMNSHLRYGKSEVVVNYMHGVFPDYKNDGNSLAVKKRRSELETVLEMYNQVNSTFKGNHSIHTILMGDFNLNPPSFAMLKEFSKSKRNNSSRKEKFDLEMKQTEKTTVKSKEFKIKPLSTGMYLDNSYDHFLIDTSRDNSLSVQKIDTIKDYFMNDEHPNIANRKHLSDHLPVMMTINIK